MDQKTVLITGASRGIGLATALEFLKNGYKVIATATSRDSFRDFPIFHAENVEFMSLDFNDLDHMHTITERITAEYDSIDVLINNAGIYLDKVFKNTTFEEILNIMHINLMAPMEFTKAMLPLLEKKHGSQIINISSTGALIPSEFHSVYCASKAALTTFSENLKLECNKVGVKVSVIHPGSVNTWNDPLPQKLLQPEDVASLCRFIVETGARCQIDDVRLSSL